MDLSLLINTEKITNNLFLSNQVDLVEDPNKRCILLITNYEYINKKVLATFKTLRSKY